MSDRWTEKELLRRERMRRKHQTPREQIEEDLDQIWYTVPEAAEELGEHPKTVYKRIRRGEIEAHKWSQRKIMIRYTNLAAYMSKRAGENS